MLLLLNSKVVSETIRWTATLCLHGQNVNAAFGMVTSAVRHTVPRELYWTKTGTLPSTAKVAPMLGFRCVRHLDL